jgi:bifunctional DNase/RNase
MIPVELVNVVLSDKGFVLLLKNRDNEKVLPIFVGQLEAQSILIALSDTEPQRPLTHDLFKDLIEKIPCTLVRVEIFDLIDDTFYAKMVLDCQNKTMVIDSRPSDAIGISIRTNAPIFVEARIYESSAILLTEETSETSDIPVSPDENSAPVLPQLSPLESLKKSLDTAITNEQYEEAARLRDEIKKLNTDN